MRSFLFFFFQKKSCSSEDEFVVALSPLNISAVPVQFLLLSCSTSEKKMKWGKGGGTAQVCRLPDALLGQLKAWDTACPGQSHDSWSSESLPC